MQYQPKKRVLVEIVPAFVQPYQKEQHQNLRVASWIASLATTAGSLSKPFSKMGI